MAKTTSALLLLLLLQQAVAQPSDYDLDGATSENVEDLLKENLENRRTRREADVSPSDKQISGSDQFEGPELGARNRRQAVESYKSDYNPELEHQEEQEQAESIRIRQDFSEYKEGSLRGEANLENNHGNLHNVDSLSRIRRQSSLTYSNDVVSQQKEWIENGTHRINQYSRLIFPMSNDIDAILTNNIFYNGTHKIDMINNVVHPVPSYTTTSSLPAKYQVIIWFYEGFIKTDTFRNLASPIREPKYNSSVYYGYPNSTYVYRNDSNPNFRVPEWTFNGTHVVAAFNKIAYRVSFPNKGSLVSNIFQNETHKVDLVTNMVTVTGVVINTNYPSYGRQTVTWYMPADGLIKTDSFYNIKKEVQVTDFNVADIYESDTGRTLFYKNVSVEYKPEWSYNGTHLVNTYTRVAYYVPSPIQAVLVKNVYNNITHETDYLSKISYPIHAPYQGKQIYQTIGWYFNGLIRTDTIRDLQGPIIDPEFKVAEICKPPSSTYIYKNESKPPATYVPPELAPQYMINKTHVVNILGRIAYPISDPSTAKIISNVFSNATHKIDLLNDKIYVSGYATSSTTSTRGTQVISWEIDGVVRTDTYNGITKPDSKPQFAIGPIYIKPPNYTTIYKQEKVIQDQWINNGTYKINPATREVYPLKEEWLFNGTHKISTMTKIAYPVETLNPQPPMPSLSEWIFNGTHKVNLKTRDAFPVDNVATQPPKEEWIYNGTHKINLHTKIAYPIDTTRPPPPPPAQKEWAFNGTHMTKDAFPVESGRPVPPKEEWIFNGTHKINTITNVAYPVRPPTFKDEWTFNGTHKINLATNEAYPVNPLPLTPKEEIRSPARPVDEFVFNGTHKVNYLTGEAYSVEDVGSKRVTPALETPEYNLAAGKKEQEIVTARPEGPNQQFSDPPPVQTASKPTEQKPTYLPMQPPTVNTKPPATPIETPKSPIKEEVKSTSKVPTQKPTLKADIGKATKAVTTKEVPKKKMEPRVQCASQNFKDAQYCCKSHTIDDIFGKSEMLKCNNNKPSAKLFAYTSEYLLNAYQNLDLPIALNNSYIIQKLQEPSCFLQCLVKSKVKNAYETTESGKYNIAALESYLTRKIRKGAKEFFSKQLYQCDEDASKLSQSAQESKCSLYPLVLVQCLHRRLLAECSKPELTPDCTSTLATLKKCNPLEEKVSSIKTVQKENIGAHKAVSSAKKTASMQKKRKQSKQNTQM